MSTAQKPVTGGSCRAPVIMQMEALECGAASLGMVLAYYGKWLPLEQLRVACDVSRDGSNAKKLLMAARGYGLDAKGYRFEPEALRASGSFPCICHMGFNHFVVVCGFKKACVLINDPARGRIEMPLASFDEQYTGVSLLFEPTDTFKPGGRPASVWSFAKDRLKGAGPAILFAVISTLIASGVAFIQPAFSRVLVDRLLSGQNPEWLMPVIALMALVAAVQLGAGILRAVYYKRIEGKLAIAAETGFFWHLLHLPMEFFAQRMAGDLIARQDENADIASSVIQTVAPLVLDTAMMFVYLFVLLQNSPALTAIGLAAVLINIFSARYISGKRIGLMRVMTKNQGKKTATAMNGIRTITSIKASGAESAFFSLWAGYQAAEYQEMAKTDRLNAYLGSVPQLISALANICVLGAGVLFTFEGNFTVGMLLAFQGFLMQFNLPVQSLIDAGQTIQAMRVQMERVEDVMAYPAQVRTDEMPEGAAFEKLTGHVEMKNLTFGYAKLDPPLIEDFSLTLTPGRRVALVGASGCGKSTVARLLSGLYSPWSGEVLYDGVPVSEVPRPVLCGSVAVVDQEITLFEDTIKSNISMWDRSIEDFEVILAARDASLHDDITKRPGGYEALLSEDGKNLSGGQRQRMEIARVLAQDPTIVILDEATSALDAATEHEVVTRIKDRGIACLIVAHRLSTIRDCDEIIVLDKGKIVERGTHEALYAMGGAYARLMETE